MVHGMKLLATALIAFTVGCQTTQGPRHETLRDKGPVKEQRRGGTQADRNLIRDICIDSGDKPVCHRTMTAAIQDCQWLAKMRIDHARCIIGSVQDQLRGSGVKYLLLGGRQ